METSPQTNQEVENIKSSPESKEETYFDILKKKINPEYLPAEEKLVLMEQATENVIAQIVAENNGKLPPFIVYPETSARVLPYLFNPSFRKISEQTNTQAPASYFMSTFHSDYFKIYSGTSENRESEMEKLKARKVLEKERANEILENAKLRGYNTDAITIIDDTKIGGMTRSSLEDAFVGKNTRHHVLFEEYIEEIRKPSERAGLSFDMIYISDNFRRLGVFWQDENQKKSIGVTKNKEDKYVEKSDESYQEAMKSLRDILSTVGEDVAERLYKDGILEDNSNRLEAVNFKNFFETSDIVILSEDRGHGKHLMEISSFLDQFHSQLSGLFIEFSSDLQNSIDNYINTGVVDRFLSSTFEGAMREGKDIRTETLALFDKLKEYKIPVICYDASKTKTAKFNKKAKNGYYFINGECRDEDMFNNVAEYYQNHSGKYVVVVGSHHMSNKNFEGNYKNFGPRMKEAFADKCIAVKMTDSNSKKEEIYDDIVRIEENK